MSLVTTKIITSRVNNLLNDPDYIRWSEAELLDYLNDALKAVVIRRPDAHVVELDAFVCAEGTKQSLPDHALRLIDIICNASGRAITGPYKRKVLDENYVNWYAGKEAAEAQLYVYDERRPKTFYLYPGVVADTEIELSYSKAPDAITLAQHEAGQVIPLDDIYQNAIIEWVQYRCYGKDAEYAADPAKSTSHLNAFENQLGIKNQADGAMMAEQEG